MKNITLDLLTENSLPEAQAIDRSDVGEDFVDSVDTLMDLTREGLKRGYLGHTFLVRRESVCVGVLLLGEGIPWKTDPEELQGVPFYRLMGFIMDRSCRGQGIASALLEAFHRYGREHGLACLLLEVRPSNRKAVALYQKFGYTEAGRRKNYYLSPKEDAIIMRLELAPCTRKS